MFDLIKNIYKAVHNAINHDGFEHAGYISFLIMLSIFPFLIFMMTASGLIGEEKLTNFFITTILDSSWAQFINALKPRIHEITTSPPQSLLTVAIISAIWTASSIFEGLRTILNKSFRVQSTPHYILRRLFSFVEFLVAVLIILAFAIVMLLIPIVVDLFNNTLEITNPLILKIANPNNEYVRDMILYAFAFLAINYSYYALPNKKQRFTSLFPGSFLVVVAWGLFSYFFGYYVLYFPQVNLLYGSIAGIIIALLYFYFSSFIYIIGAEFNYLLSAKKKK